MATSQSLDNFQNGWSGSGRTIGSGGRIFESAPTMCRANPHRSRVQDHPRRTTAKGYEQPRGEQPFTNSLAGWKKSLAPNVCEDVTAQQSRLNSADTPLDGSPVGDEVPIVSHPDLAHAA